MSDQISLYISIFAWLFLTGIGLPPIPEEAGILYAASLHATNPDIRWPLAWLATGSGIVCADLLLYTIGRTWGLQLFEFKWVQRLLKQERRERLEGRFHQHGIKLLILARFLPPLRTGVFLIAGAAKYSFVKFLIADLIYAVVGVGTFFFGGSYLIGMLEQLRRAGAHWIPYLAAAPVACYGLYRYYKYLKAKELAKGVLPPVSIVSCSKAATKEDSLQPAPAKVVAAIEEAKVLLKD